ncbi:myotubularin-related protein 9-like [Macrobrachium nipponense]|uniref:myotubularin-related protein 9-like n=1 Tax=Macrobrachium nipponense TaxID=159736 RepID=UPI0030C7A61F
MYTVLEDGWTAFTTESEFSRLIQPGDDWRISYVNKDYKVCSSYPSAVVVPKSVEDSDLIAIANFRQSGRFPVLAYRHEGMAVLMQSGQPLITANGKRCKEDERLLNGVLAREKRGYIIDTRTQNLAQSAKVRLRSLGNFGCQKYLTVLTTHSRLVLVLNALHIFYFCAAS